MRLNRRLRILTNLIRTGVERVTTWLRLQEARLATFQHASTLVTRLSLAIVGNKRGRIKTSRRREEVPGSHS